MAYKQFGVPAYESLPTQPAIGGLVVIHEIFGVNSHIRKVADDWAQEGYAVLAPCLFDRLEPDLQLDYSPESVQKGMRCVKALNGYDQPLADIEECVADLASRGLQVSVVGFCWGGSLAWMAADRLPIHRAVGYYGGQIYANRLVKPKVPVMLHFGKLDAHIPMDQVDEIQALYPEVVIHRYDAGHGFNCEQRKDYDEVSARLAFGRTRDFLREAL